MKNRSILIAFLVLLAAATVVAFVYFHLKSQRAFQEPFVLSTGWQLQDVAKVPQPGADVSQPGFQPTGWLQATVPGTVLTTLVDRGVYPEPLYGENNRPDKIPESLSRTSYWYRTVCKVPGEYAQKQVWLNFDGINYAAEVWVNGRNAGAIKGAFARGVFDVTSLVTPGQDAAVAVLVSPQPHPGDPIEHTVANGLGKNGGITAIDGPTFLCSIGWDWIPGIRDRNTGIWQKVFLSATGPVLIKDPLVTSDLPLPSLETADIAVQATVQNTSDQIQHGFLKGTIGEVSFQEPVSLEGHASRLVALDPKTIPQLRFQHPKLWWPNGYGPQNLYKLHLSFEIEHAVSDRRDVSFGVRKVTYSVPDSENLTLSVNGVRVYCKGGDWGMDDAMKRVPRARLEAQIRMHQLANLNMIRNWVGQSTNEDFYELCDQYGIMLWDEFFQPNPSDGPNPTDLATYITNVREKILRFRNHPSIVVWCGRNEGRPPKEIDDAIREVMNQLEPVRLYQPSSTDGRGVHSGGPYRWRTPRDFYKFGEPFKTEIGSVSIPTLESIHGMMPEKDWETINDDWAEHDLARGAQGGDSFPQQLSARYGKVANLADFARKGQLATYEAFRAMYEGREAKLFNPSTAIITWMSHPAQPSFVWQLYHYDLEPNAALFAVQKACEPVHILLNENTGAVQVINHLGTSLSKAQVHLAVFNLDGSKALERDFAGDAAPSQATTLGSVDWPTNLSPVCFVQLQLRDAQGSLMSDNFYWRGAPGHEDELRGLETLPEVGLRVRATRQDANGKCLVDVSLENPSAQVALMAHVQLRRQSSSERVLPVFYSNNYVSLVPHESKTLTVEADPKDLKGDKPLITLDGWNVAVAPSTLGDVEVVLNKQAQVSAWPVTGLPLALNGFKAAFERVKIQCGGKAVADFIADAGFDGGRGSVTPENIDVSASSAAPQEVYHSERYDECTYVIPMKAAGVAPRTFLVRLHFAEVKFDQPGQRKFNVDLNKTRVLADFDIFAEAGAKDKAVVKDFAGIAPDPNGNITIRLTNGAADKAKINGIEILPTEAAP